MSDDKYIRQKIIPGFGDEGQLKLERSNVLIVGCGGLGCPIAIYLARAGVGKLILIDSDTISKSNLHRQILFSDNDVGHLKVEVAAIKIHEANQDVEVETHSARLGRHNINQLLDSADVVVDGSDNFETKYLIIS